MAGVQPVLADEAVPADPVVYVDLNGQGGQQQELPPVLTLEASPGAGTSRQLDTMYSGGTNGPLVGPLDFSDTTPPTIDSIRISPSSVPLGSSFQVTYTVSDSGGSGLNSVQLQRSNDQNTWQFVAQNSALGNGPVTGALSDTPGAEGDWWYRIQVFDVALNSITLAPPLQVTVSPDITPPSPNPSAWSVVPHATGATSIQMAAMTAADANGVEYYFHEISGNPGATESGWQDSNVYEDTGLLPSTTYTYQVKTRDKSPNHNETAYSGPAPALTDADTTPPSPNPSTWAVAPYATAERTDSIRMVATAATDVSGVEYYFREISDNPGATDSGWQDSNIYEDTGLLPSTTYTYQVMTRDMSPNHNQTQPTEPASATTLADTTPPVPSPSTWAAAPYATGIGSVFMAANVATDVSGVEYYFHETSGNPGATDSAWQDSNVYEDTGLSSGTVYTYVVKTRDRSVNHNEGQYSAAASVTTPSPVYRFWSLVLQRHFYTIWEGEKNKLINNYANVWTYEQVAYYAFAGATDPLAAPVYRFWSASLQTHFYTMNAAERDKLIKDYPSVWTPEGAAFYTYAKDAPPQGTSAVYRFWSGSAHFYTINAAERDKLINDPLHIWTYEMEAWYAYPAPIAPA
ncbi:MAG: hypothetical protein M1376_22015 [Planctomycetes bacterium]|nr:hypothetical protein [Planctomycetota bacterium]